MQQWLFLWMICRRITKIKPNIRQIIAWPHAGQVNDLDIYRNFNTWLLEYELNQGTHLHMIIMCIGVSTLPQKHHPSSFFPRPPPPPFPPSLNPHKNRIFQWTPIMLKFFILNLIPSFKVTKFLIKISQFKFLVVTEKNIFADKPFLSLNIWDFSLIFM